MPKYEERESLLKKMVGSDFKNNNSKEEFEENFREEKEHELVNYIISYPVPNSKEDLLEFMILITSNIDLKEELDNEVQKAWINKMEQINKKAQLSVTDKEDLVKITELYDKKKREIRNKKTITKFEWIGLVAAYIALWGFIDNPLLTVIVLLVILIVGLVICYKFPEKLPFDFPKDKIKKEYIYGIFGVLIVTILTLGFITKPLLTIVILLLFLT